MSEQAEAASIAWAKLGLGVRFLWCKVAYEVVTWPEQGPGPFSSDVCQIRRMGKAGKLYGPVRRFTYQNCVIELPVILKGGSDHDA